MVAGGRERLEGLAREVSALRVAVDANRAACPPRVAADGGSTPAPAPPEHAVATEPTPDDDATDGDQQELVAEAEQVLDRAARQHYWSERERDDFKRVVRRIHGPRVQELFLRAVRGLNGDFPPRLHGPPL